MDRLGRKLFGSVAGLVLVLLGGCAGNLKNNVPRVAACEAGESRGCGTQILHRRAEMDAAAIVLGMRFAVIRYNLQDDSVP